MKKERKNNANINMSKFRPRSFSAVFYSNYDGRILLKQADETYLKLCCCTEKDIGADIIDILEYKEYNRIKYYLDSYKGQKFKLNYVEKFSNCSNMLWQVNAVVNYSVMKIEGQLIEFNNENMIDKIDNDNEENKKYGIIIISRKENGYFVEFCSENIMGMIPGIVLGKYIDENTIKILNPIKYCINEKRKTKSSNIFTFTNGKKEIIKICAKPVCREDCDAAVVEVSLYDINDYNKNYETETDEFFQKNIIGSGIISCETQNNMYFEEINPYLTKLIKEDKIKRETLINSHPFRSAIYEQLLSLGKISYYNDNGEKTDYIMGAVPIVEGGIVLRIFVFVILTENRDMIDSSIFNDLTPREVNVLRLAVEGLDNRHIGEALNITEGTAKRELFYCYKKLGVKNKTEIIRKLYHL